MNWPKSLSKNIKTKVNLANYTSFKIAAVADFFLEIKDIDELRDALSFAKSKHIPIFILGAGSNILASDRVKGLVIKLDGKYFKKLEKSGNYLLAGSGLKLNQLILFAQTKCLSGLEFLAGIPGTVGGSLLGNAGAWGQAIGGLVKQACVVDYQGRLKLLSDKQLKFSYRKSNLDSYIIVWVKLKLKISSKNNIALRIKDHLLQRLKTQKNSLPNAGCIFKNPAGKKTAGLLIDLCGLKGKRKGGAVVSETHANFILNLGGAKSRDVVLLMNLIRQKVKSKFGINLQPEVKLWK
ncbi:MAG: UDP-N-acetylmuramate dehydrogenase [Candidatus Omnitrophota bacterium]